MKTIDQDALQELTAELVHAAIEGGGCDMIDLIAQLADLVGVPYEAVDCSACGGFADKATAAEQHGGVVCDGCARA